jgi:UDP-N-acetylglucosamine--N-acetylmuramyl-(pentapeptide) pyrophosphoryl-undecaprenol N-acetylglucosamine transferase
VARAGAGTLWEIGALGIPGILIPLTAGSRGDQVRNAEVFSRTGAYTTLIDPSQEEFCSELVSLVEDGQKRSIMAGRAQRLPRDAARRIADYLVSFVNKNDD